MKNIFHELENDSKEETIPLNNTISCYHRPHINYFNSKKNQNKKKIKMRNHNHSKEAKSNQFQMNISYENINNNNNNKENIFTKTYSNINKKSLCVTSLKYKNINKIKINKNNYMINKILVKTNKKPSISKDIAILCKIINSINYNHNNELNKNKNNKKIAYINPKKSVRFIYFNEKVIKIQRWWRNLLYHLYIERYILMIQKHIRKYLKRKKYLLENKTELNIKKIILIQKEWKKYMTKKCLHDYYFFSFKKYIKPKEDNKLINISKSNLIHHINNINNINNVINNKDKKNNHYISKIYYKISQINNVNQTIIKLQKAIKKFLYNKKYIDKYKNINNNLKELPSSDKCGIKEENSSVVLNLMKKKFSSYISCKLSMFFILLLKRINLFYFIKIVIQRIEKNINHFIFIQLFNFQNKSYNTYSYFFQTIWRHIKINLNTNNEISSLLNSTIPKFFKKEFTKKYIPYINSSQEDKLLNMQLFINNNDDLINYILYFFEKEKNIKINISKKYINTHLDKYNLKNRNIFCITRYIDTLYNNLMQKIEINEIKENIDINEDDYYYIQTQENNYIINNDTFNTNKINRAKTYEIKNFKCKFKNYLDKNNE